MGWCSRFPRDASLNFGFVVISPPQCSLYCRIAASDIHSRTFGTKGCEGISDGLSHFYHSFLRPLGRSLGKEGPQTVANAMSLGERLTPILRGNGALDTSSTHIFLSICSPEKKSPRSTSDGGKEVKAMCGWHHRNEIRRDSKLQDQPRSVDYEGDWVMLPIKVRCTTAKQCLSLVAH